MSMLQIDEEPAAPEDETEDVEEPEEPEKRVVAESSHSHVVLGVLSFKEVRNSLNGLLHLGIGFNRQFF